MRVLPTEHIPVELWMNRKLRLPEYLKISYSEKLNELGVLDKATVGKPGKKDIHGGLTDEETIEHFTYRFSPSSGRIEFVSLSPDDSMVEVSNAILSTFSEGEVSVLDIPCGTGSSICSLLTTIAFLRNKSVLPSLPLKVRIMGGDYSPKALEIYSQMLNRVKPLLSESAISITFDSMLWDATRGDHTAALIDSWFALANDQGEYVVCITNFTGALIGADIFEQFSPCLNQILGRLHNKKSTMLWIEPRSNATTKLTKKLMLLIKATINWFKKTGEEDKFYSSKYTMVNPLNNNEHDSTVEVQRFKRT